jgi:hypothetical protein
MSRPAPSSGPGRGAGGDAGFTIIEILVAASTGLIVLFAVFTLLEVSVRYSARSLDRVETAQRARSAMETVVQELHSSCVTAPETPVLAGSTDTSVSFLSQFGGATVITPNEHVVSLSGGTLTDATYPATGGSAPNWTFASTPSTSRELASNISQALVGGSAQPVFQYYTYSGGQISTTPLPTPLSAADAANTVEVAISFAVAPTDGSTDGLRATNVTDEVVLRVLPAATSAAGGNPPCQ